MIGHPLDTIKTKMQGQVNYKAGSAWSTLSKVVRTEGVLALYRGLLPPLLGSSLFRSIQVSVVYGLRPKLICSLVHMVLHMVTCPARHLRQRFHILQDSSHVL